MKTKAKTVLSESEVVGSPDTWFDRETMGCQFKDERLDRRFRALLKQLSEGLGESIPFACQDWANTKAAYRFFANERVSEEEILAGHFRSTRERFAGTNSTVLMLHDTTEILYGNENIGVLNHSL